MKKTISLPYGLIYAGLHALSAIILGITIFMPAFATKGNPMDSLFTTFLVILDGITVELKNGNGIILFGAILSVAFAVFMFFSRIIIAIKQVAKSKIEPIFKRSLFIKALILNVLIWIYSILVIVIGNDWKFDSLFKSSAMKTQMWIPMLLQALVFAGEIFFVKRYNSIANDKS